MTNKEINLARKWAEEIGRLEGLRPGLRAAIDLIQSLPDQWIDAEKVAELANDMANWSLPVGPSITEIDYRRLIEIMDGFTGRINDLITPPLPTLADMDEDARHAFVGKDVKVEGWSSPSMLIAVHKDEGAVLGHTWINPWPFVEVRPLSDLTPVPAPEQEAEDDEPIMMPRPEDVPAGEPWLVKCGTREWVGTRESRVEIVCPWALARFDGADYTVASDDDITLISRLVPEIP